MKYLSDALFVSAFPRLSECYDVEINVSDMDIDTLKKLREGEIG
jgi:hypothetical protein